MRILIYSAVNLDESGPEHLAALPEPLTEQHRAVAVQPWPLLGVASGAPSSRRAPTWSLDSHGPLAMLRLSESHLLLVHLRHKMLRSRPRQLYLGSSASGTLAIVDNYTLPPAEAPFLSLPSETLFRIFELAVIPDRDPDAVCLGHEQCNYSAILTLLLTCRQFSSLCLPLLYRDIHFHRTSVVPPEKGSKLLHSLRRMPGLGRHCSVLTIEGSLWHRPAPEINHAADIANGLISWLPSVQDLRFHGNFESQSIWPLLRAAVAQMPRVEALTLRVWGLELHPLFDNASFPLLKKLVLDRLSETGARRTVIHSKNERTAPFTKLSVSDCEARHKSFAQVLLWPQHLTHFLFKNYSYDSSYHIDPPSIRTMLLPHIRTLERVNIGYQRDPDHNPRQLLDVSDFPKLERLGLSRRQMAKDLVFSAADASLLLAPILRTFEWDFSLKDCYGIDCWYNFGEQEENWLREFLRLAVKRKAALKNVIVVFGTEPWNLPSVKEGKDMWDRLDGLKKEFHLHGVMVTWTQPRESQVELD